MLIKGNSKLVEKLAKDVEELDYNVYQLFLQNYYDGKYPLKKGMFFDGFVDENMIDNVNSNILLQQSLRKITNITPTSIISQNQYSNKYGLGGNTSDNYSIAQTIYLRNDDYLKDVTFKINKVGNPTETINCYLYKMLGNNPNQLISTSPVKINGIDIIGTMDIKFDFNIPLKAGDYAIVLSTGAVSSTNYFQLGGSSGNVYGDGTALTNNSAVWYTQNYDYYFVVNLGNKCAIPIYYQSKEQVFSQGVDNAYIYIKSKTTSGCSVGAEIAVYNDTPIFIPMNLIGSRDLGGGYQEDKFSISGLTGTKAKAKIKFNVPNIDTVFEVTQFGCILGVM